MRSFLSELSHSSSLWSGDSKRCDDDQHSESSNEEDAISLGFGSFEPFLCNGVAFNNFKGNLRRFVFPQSKDSRSAAQKGAMESGAARKIVKRQQFRLKSDIKAASEVTSPQECHLENGGYQGEPETSSNSPTQALMYFEEFKSEPSIGDRLKVFIERILGQSVLWWPLKNPFDLWQVECVV